MRLVLGVLESVADSKMKVSAWSDAQKNSEEWKVSALSPSFSFFF